MTDITIPPEAVEAGAMKLAEGRLPEYSWADLDDEMRNMYREDAITAILAALKAWPGAAERRSWDGSIGRLILPLTTQEPGE